MKNSAPFSSTFFRLILATSLVLISIFGGACSKSPNLPHENDSSNQGTKNPPDTPALPQAPAQSDGGITSGGSFIYENTINPWFLQNTTEIKYCIDIDEDNFGVSKEKIAFSISNAIEIWRKALSNAEYLKYGSNDLGSFIKPWFEVRLGTQIFNETNCEDKNVLLKFQMGKLTPDQRQVLGNPNKFIAATVQTFYDEVAMRGQGFIYVSPENGDLRPTLKGLCQNHWERREISVQIKISAPNPFLPQRFLGHFAPPFQCILQKSLS